MTKLLEFGARILRAITPTAWLVLAVLVAFLLFGGYCARRAANDVRDDQALTQARAEARASSGRETAATERTLDTRSVSDRQQERDDAAESLPDSVPDERELRRRCRQLRDAGRDLPACRGFESPSQASPAG